MVPKTRLIANCLALVLALFFLAACGGEDGSNETGPGPACEVNDLDGSDVPQDDAEAREDPEMVDGAEDAEFRDEESEVVDVDNADVSLTDTEVVDGDEDTEIGTCSGDPAAPGEAFVRIAAGTFTMGSPSSELGRDSGETQHEVTLTRDFWLQTTEVTQGDYQPLMGSNPSYFTACGASCPVETVSWFDAIAYANALSRAEGLPECYDDGGNVIGGTTVYECCGYRLPTEAEWEYAARAGTSTATYRGNLTGEPFSCDSQPNLDPIAWFCGNSPYGTRAVGTRSANAWGLHDMLGNVWEWTSDWYDDYPGAVTDPVGPSTGSFRVLRGGSCYDFAFFARAARRFGGGPDDRLYGGGFRLARSLP